MACVTASWTVIETTIFHQQLSVASRYSRDARAPEGALALAGSRDRVHLVSADKRVFSHSFRLPWLRFKQRQVSHAVRVKRASDNEAKAQLLQVSCKDNGWFYRPYGIVIVCGFLRLFRQHIKTPENWCKEFCDERVPKCRMHKTKLIHKEDHNKTNCHLSEENSWVQFLFLSCHFIPLRDEVVSSLTLGQNNFGPALARNDCYHLPSGTHNSSNFNDVGPV